MNFLFRYMIDIPAVLFFLLFLMSLFKNKRRFRNGLYLLFFIIFASVSLLFHTQGNQIWSYAALFLILFVFILCLLVPCLLIANGIVIIKKEGFSLANMLSMLYAAFIFAGEASLFYSVFYAHEAFASPIFTLLFLFGYFVFYTSLIFLAFILYSFVVQMIPRKTDYDYIIVLGCGLLNGNQVSKLLAGRLEKAVKLYRRSMSSVKIICSGGQGPDETISEAEAMMHWLIMHNIPARDILVENESTDTMENLNNSRRMIKSRKGRQITAIVTSDYHVMRALVYADRLNFPAEGTGSRTAGYYWPSAITREYAAMIKYYLISYMLGYVLTALVLFTLRIYFL